MSEKYIDRVDEGKDAIEVLTVELIGQKNEKRELVSYQNAAIQEISKKFNIHVDVIVEAFDSIIYARDMIQSGKYTDERITEAEVPWDELVSGNKELFESLTANDDSSPVYFQKQIDTLDLKIAHTESLIESHNYNMIELDIIELVFQELGFNYMQLADEIKTIADLQKLHQDARKRLGEMFIGGNIGMDRYIAIGKYLTDENMRLLNILNERSTE